MADITRAEFYEKYGEVEVTFSSYYKYVFTYTGVTEDGVKISVDYGGNDSEIYRHDVSVGAMEKVNRLYPFAGTATKDGKTIDEFYDY